MKDALEEQLLDYEGPEGPQFTNNRLVSSVRFGLCAYFFVNLIRQVFLQWPVGLQGVNMIAFVIGMLVPLMIYGLYLYYNLEQGLMEYQDEEIFPVFRLPFNILCMIVAFGLICLTAFNWANISIPRIAVMGANFIILRREVQYFKLLRGL